MLNRLRAIVWVVCGALLLPFSGQAAEVSVTLSSGWNLLNSPVQPGANTITQVLGTAVADTTSVWKWSGATWAVYLPGAGDGGQAYAASKSFGLLSVLDAGEGFWLNMAQPGQLLIDGQYPADTVVALTQGWNLVGLKGSQPALVTDITVDQGLAIISLWKWTGSTWAVYLPGEADKGQQYAASKNFSLVADINPQEGFWVNVATVPGGVTTTSTLPPTTTTTGTVASSTTTLASTTTTTTAPTVTTTTASSTTTTTTTLPPNTAVGKVFAKIGPTLVPVQNAEIYVDDQKIAESDYTGLFHYTTTTELVVTVKADGYDVMSGSLTPGATRSHFLLTPTIEEVGDEGWGKVDLLEKVNGKWDPFKIHPNLFIMEADYPESAKPSPKVIWDDHAAISITDMSLAKDITVSVDTFLASDSIIDATAVNELLAVGQGSAVIGGANVLVKDSSGGATTSQAAGFGGKVRPSLADFNLSGNVKSLAAMQADLAGGSAMVYLFAYSPQEDSPELAWQLVGEGEIVDTEGGGYEVRAAKGVAMDGLYPFLFLYGAKKSVIGTVVHQGATGLEPVANALIKLQNSGVTAVSGPDGGFVLNIPDTLTKGSIRVYHEEYYRLQKKVVLPKGSASVEDIGPVKLIPLTTFDLQGVLSDHHDAPLVGAEVRLTFAAVPPQIIFPAAITTWTDASGFYQFPRIPQELKAGATVEVTTSNGFQALVEQTWPLAIDGVVTLNVSLVTPIWVYQTGGQLYAAPAVAGNSLYLGGVDHWMRSLDTATGQENWAYDAGIPIFATPAVDADNLYFPILKNQLVALTRQTKVSPWATNPTQVNQFDPENKYHIVASPVLTNGILSFGSLDDSIYFFDTNGANTSSTYLGGNITGSAAVANNTIYFGAWDGRFYGFMASGSAMQLMEPQWQFPAQGQDPLPARILSSPLAVDGKVYFGGGNNLTVNVTRDNGTVESYPFSTDGLHQPVNFFELVVNYTITVDLEDKHLYCLNGSDGTLLWSRDLDGAVVGRPAMNGSTLIVGTLHGTVSAFDLTAAPTAAALWTFTAKDAVYSSPVVSGGRVYFGSSDHYLYCLDAATGAKLWTMRTGGEIIAAPVVADGRIFVASLDGILYCLEE